MTPIPPTTLDALLSPYVEEYNSAQKILKIFLLIADWDLIEVDNPYQDIIDMANQLYEQATIDLIEELLSMGRIDYPDSFPQYPGGASVEIQESYLLEEIHPTGYIPASIVDYTTWDFLKYRKLQLIYKYLPEISEDDYSKIPYNRPSLAIPSDLGYPDELINGWQYPNLTSTNPPYYINIFSEYGYTSPCNHWRYRVLPEWVLLLSAWPEEDDPTWQSHMISDVWECFRPAIPADGPGWWSEDFPYAYISKGINDDWGDSYNELVSRGFAPNGYMRPQRWMSFTDIPHQIYYHPTLPQTHLQVHMRLHTGRPTKIYHPNGSPGGIIPIEIFFPLVLDIFSLFGVPFPGIRKRRKFLQ